MKQKLILMAAALVVAAGIRAQLVTYPEGFQTGMAHNDDYTVRVRTVGGEWKDLFEYNVRVDMDKVQDASMVQFDMGSPVEVMVKKNNGTVREVAVRPLNNGVVCKQVQNAVFFTLDRPQYLSVEFNGDRLHNLHLFANPLEAEVYSEEADGVMYFGPGVHRPKDLPNNQIRIPANTTVYLAPGAVVKAKLLVDNVENVRIIGRGILDQPIRGIEITDSKNVLVDGITVVNPEHYTVFGGGSSDITVRNLKSFSCKGWSDGIDMMCCRKVMIDNVFMRNSDDCIALYNHRWSWWGGSGDITVKNSVLWADVAHPINVGGHGDPDSDTGEVIENLTFRNIDILEHDEDDPPYQGCMAVDCGDKNRVRNILFEDIRVENIQEGRLFYIKVRFNKKYDKQPGGSIDGITFRNITYTGVGEAPSLIEGLDKGRMVKNVTFENVMINGEQMKDLDGVVTNEFVENIGFLAGDMPMVKKGRVEVDNGSLYYEEAGEGEPIIFVHGHSLDHRMWEGQFTEFAREYRVIRYDLRGYGHSSLQTEDYQFTHVKDLVTLMDSLHIGKAHIVGLSLGGYVGADMLACYPERMLSALLASGNIRKSKGPSQPMTEEEARKRDEEIATVKKIGIGAMKREWFEGLMKSGGSKKERMRKLLWEMIEDWDAWQPLHKEVRVVVGLDAYELLKTNHPEVPTLLVEGKSPGNHYSAYPEILNFLPNGRMKVLNDCGHMLNMEQPEIFNKALEEFLKGL